MSNEPDSRLTHDYKFSPSVEKIFDALLAIIILFEVALLFGSTMFRAITKESITWANEVAGFALGSLAFIGGAIAYHRGEHMTMRFFLDRLPKQIQEYCESAANYLILVVGILTVSLGFPMFSQYWVQYTPALEIRMSWTILPFIIGMALLALFALRRISKYSLRGKVVGGLLILVLGTVWFLAQLFFGPWGGFGGLMLALTLLLAFVLAGVPIAFVLSIISYMFLISSKAADMISVPSSMVTGTNNLVLLAIPFFILAGDIMAEGGLTKPLANWVYSLVGRFRGGLMQASIVFMYVFSGISGSKVADIAAVGTTMKGMLKDEGYEPAESTAVFASAGVMGETIPPCLNMMVMASASALSVGTFFIAGIIPALVIALALMIFIYFRALALGWPKGNKASVVDITKSTFYAIPALLVPIILVAGIVGGIATPTEVSSFAVIYACLISLLLYRKVGVKDLWKTFSHAAVTSGMILFLCAAGSALSRSLMLGDLPNLITQFFGYFGGSAVMFWLCSIVVMVILSAMLDGLPALLVLGPMLLPIAPQYGINGIQLGIALVIAMGVGAFLPPIGVCFFVTCSVFDSTVEESTPKYLPYLLIIFLGLLLVAAVPWFSLVLPQLLHLSVAG